VNGDVDFRTKFEEWAERYHALAQQVGLGEHRFWKFRNCPAPSCAEARAALVSQGRGVDRDPDQAVGARAAASSDEKPGA